MISFADALYQVPTARLRVIAHRRSIEPKRLALAPNKRHLSQILARELSDMGSVSRALDRCDVRATTLLEGVLAHARTGAVTWDIFRDQVLETGSEAPMLRILEQLEMDGLVLRLQDVLYVPDAVRHMVGTSVANQFTVEQCLQAYDAPTIRRMCDNLKLRPTETTKQAGVVAIVDALLHRTVETLARLALSSQEEEVLKYVLASGGDALAIEVAQEVLEGSEDDFYRYDWPNRWRQGRERNAIDRLLGRGLLYVVSQGYGYQLLLVVPGDLLRTLMRPVRETFWSSPAPAPEPADSAPATMAHHTSLLRDIVVLLSFIDSNEVARTNTGHIHKSSLKAVARTMSLPDDRYAAFVYAAARNAGLIAVTDEKLLYALTRRGESWLFWDAATQLRMLFDAWRLGGSWNELLPDPLARAADPNARQNVVDVRSAILGRLSSVRPETFYTTASLASTAFFFLPRLISRIGDLGYEVVPSFYALMRNLVEQSLYWMGAIELGWTERLPASRPGIADPTPAKGRSGRKAGAGAEAPAIPPAAAFRVTALGAHLMTGAEETTRDAVPAEDSFVLQANAEIFVPPVLRSDVLFRLLGMTEFPTKSATSNIVTLTRDSVRKAIDRGDTPREIVAFLQAHSRTGVPQNVEYLIHEVGGKHGHIHVGRALMYVQTDSDLLLHELESRRELKPYVLRRLSDTVMLMNTDDQDKLLREMRKAGYLPVSDDAVRRSGFNPSRKPESPPARPTLPTNTAALPGPADTGVDWERIAREDIPASSPGKTLVPAAAKAGAARPDSLLAPHRRKTIASSIETATAGSSESTAARGAPAAADGIVHDIAHIRTMLLEAVRQHRSLEFGYRPRGSKEEIVVQVQPRLIMGNLLRAMDVGGKTAETYEINQIRWVRRLA